MRLPTASNVEEHPALGVTVIVHETSLNSEGMVLLRGMSGWRMASMVAGAATWPPPREASRHAVQVVVDVLGAAVESPEAPSHLSATVALEESEAGVGVALTTFEHTFTDADARPFDNAAGLARALELAAHSEAAEDRLVQFVLFAGQAEVGMACCDVCELAGRGGEFAGKLPIHSDRADGVQIGELLCRIVLSEAVCRTLLQPPPKSVSGDTPPEVAPCSEVGSQHTVPLALSSETVAHKKSTPPTCCIVL